LGKSAWKHFEALRSTLQHYFEFLRTTYPILIKYGSNWSWERLLKQHCRHFRKKCLEALWSTSKHFIALFRVLENYLSDFDEIWLKMKLTACSKEKWPSV
jgi:hypothetical protein